MSKLNEPTRGKIHLVLIAKPKGFDGKKDLLDWLKTHGRGVPDGRGGRSIHITADGTLCELNDGELAAASESWDVRVIDSKETD